MSNVHVNPTRHGWTLNLGKRGVFVYVGESEERRGSGHQVGDSVNVKIRGSKDASDTDSV